MLGVAMYTTIKTLMGKGLNKSQIAKATGHDWKTVSKIIGLIESGQEIPDKKPHPRILDSHKEIILELMEQDLSGIRIHEKLKETGLKIGYSTVKNYLSGIKKRENIFIRIHTPPGKEAQVDFGYIGLTPDETGKKRKTWVFNMKLSYSRYDYYEKVYNQKVETFIQCHINAFNYFKGVPETVRIDNLKAAILKANFYEPVYQHLYKSFSNHYGFNIIPCRIYRPNDKGKVESGIKYVKNNFFAGRKFKSSNDLDYQLKKWQERVCNSRVHGTTRKIPFEIFEKEEKTKLIPIPREEFKMLKTGSRKVYHDCHIYVDYNYYSVPFEYVGKIVDIEISKSLLKVYFNSKGITIHKRIIGKGYFSTIDSHYPKYKLYSNTEYQEKYQAKMARIGEYAQQIFLFIINKNPRAWTRPIQGILSLIKTYPNEIVNLACKRALAFDACQYQTIKNICSNGSYALPVEFNFEKERDYEYVKN